MRESPAIFDLDDTLLDNASGRLFVRYLRNEKRLTEVVRKRDLPTLMAVITGFQMGLVSATRAAQFTASVVAGFQVDYFWQLVRTWFDDMLVHHINEEAKESVAWHAAQGHTLLRLQRFTAIQRAACSRIPEDSAVHLFGVVVGWWQTHW